MRSLFLSQPFAHSLAHSIALTSDVTCKGDVELLSHIWQDYIMSENFRVGSHLKSADVQNFASNKHFPAFLP